MLGSDAKVVTGLVVAVAAACVGPLKPINERHDDPGRQVDAEDVEGVAAAAVDGADVATGGDPLPAPLSMLVYL